MPDHQDMAETTNNDNPTETPVVLTVEQDNKPTDTNEEQSVDPKPDEKLAQHESTNMGRFVLPVVALLTFLLSIPFLFEAIWLLYVQQHDCEKLLKSLPGLQIGIAVGLFCVFLVSNVVVYLRARWSLAPGLIVMKIALVLMFVVGLTLRGSFEGETRQIPASPGWFKVEVEDDGNWDNIKSCLYDTKMCRDLMSRSYYPMPTHLSPIEGGCCDPPSICEMEYVNMGYWIKPNETMNTDGQYDKDCDVWQNNETVLCYDCQACKRGFVKTLEGKWVRIGTFLVVMSLLLMIFHLLLFVTTMWEQQKLT
ncbi:tetraspanin-15 [Sesamum indicum]|uniref:Tetraspanin-15 n=1 Tax=Sesamum indicum TaxID=4182 RepID=A0A6I9TFD1_SESIN|nr:tetraspanin-15 [Sesamum indicum]